MIQAFGNAANAIGRVHIEAADGTKSKVDKIFGYVFGDAGAFCMIIHQLLSLDFDAFCLVLN